jgi:hypothetical protein
VKTVANQEINERRSSKHCAVTRDVPGTEPHIYGLRVIRQGEVTLLLTAFLRGAVPSTNAASYYAADVNVD